MNKKKKMEPSPGHRDESFKKKKVRVKKMGSMRATIGRVGHIKASENKKQTKRVEREI